LKGRAAQIVACLIDQGPADVTTIAKRCSIPRSSANRVCLELSKAGDLVRRDTRPVTYAPTAQTRAPEWVRTGNRDGPEPMCKALFEASRRALKNAADRRAILDNPHYQAAAKIWGK
jgi:hypothetical protein